VKTDIQVGDTVVCVRKCDSHPRLEPWAFPPEEGSIWVVADISGDTCFTDGTPSGLVGLRLVGDALRYPGMWKAHHFRKVFPRADEKANALDVRKPTTVRA